jgi:hypothetical protein
MLKFSKIINYPLGLLGYHVQKKPKIHPLKDILSDHSFLSLYAKIRPFTLVELERNYALYQSMKYIISSGIDGDLVECGVWKGGSAMLMAYVLLEAGITNRKIFLYDTFEGMVAPGPKDGDFEKNEWNKMKSGSGGSTWCFSSEEETRRNMQSTGYPQEKVIIVKGKVEDTLPKTIPEKIALLRLDTDWYESTHHELVHLFPRLTSKGILIIDDYGAWQGARKAVDEYFDGKNFLLQRIDWTGRLLVNH